MSNDEWETIETMSSQSLTGATWTIPMEYGYEYEARRRKKAEVMPELTIGMCADFKDGLGENARGVIVNISPLCIVEINSRHHETFLDYIFRLQFRGKEIWRRK